MKLGTMEWDYNNNPLLADGAWGTELIKRGLEQGNCPEEWNVIRPDDVKSIAEAYAKAGSNIVLTNTFGGNRIKLEHYGFADRVREFNIAGAELSKAGAGEGVLIAGDISSTGKMLVMGEVTSEQLYEVYAEQTLALKEGGVDLILVETMTDMDEMAIAVKAAATETGLPVISSMTYEKMKDGTYRTIMGNTAEACVRAAAEAGAVIAGANCGSGINEYVELAKTLCELNILPVWIKANAGLPEMTENGVVYRMNTADFASYIPELLEAGVAVVGGCCGTTPEFIKEVKSVLDKHAK